MIKERIIKSSYLYYKIAEELFYRVFILQDKERLEEVKNNKPVIIDDIFGGIDFSVFCEKKSEKFKKFLDVCTDIRDRHLKKDEKIRELEKFIKDSLIEDNLHIRKEFVYGMMFYRSTEDGGLYVSENEFFDIFHSMFFCTSIDSLKEKGILSTEKLETMIDLYKITRNDKVPQFNTEVVNIFGVNFGDDNHVLTCTDCSGREKINATIEKNQAEYNAATGGHIC